jgi:hypothetical protein
MSNRYPGSEVSNAATDMKEIDSAERTVRAEGCAEKGEFSETETVDALFDA